jgi:hypothetical protein
MLLEHLRITQWDILEFSRNAKHKSPKWPDEYWPKTVAPPSAPAWDKSVTTFKQDAQAMQDLIASSSTDLFQKITWEMARPSCAKRCCSLTTTLITSHN